MADLDATRLAVITNNLEDIRNLTVCKICLKPFYEPYILGCGHTYCYTCLRSWFGSSNSLIRNKNCPDCRTEVLTQPAPNYLLRDLVHLFVSRAELLPEEETLQDHAKDRAEEATQLSNDRNGPGLFKGMFPKRPPYAGPHAIYDEDDNVMRCPICTHELEGPACNACGYVDSDYPRSDEDISDMDEGSSVLDGFEVDLRTRGPHVPQRFHGIIYSDDEDANYDTVDEYDGDAVPAHRPLDLDQYDEEDDFIDNEDEADYPLEHDNDDMSQPSEMTEYTINGSSSESDEELPVARYQHAPPATAQFMQFVNTYTPPQFNAQLEESDDEEPVRTTARSQTRRGRAAVIISDDEGEEDEEDPNSAASAHNDVINLEDDEDNDEELESIEGEEDDEDDSSDSNDDGQSEPEEPVSAPTFHAPVDDSDDSEDSSDDSEMSDQNDDPDSPGDSDESDDTTVPPQSRDSRRQRLDQHRTRRAPTSHHANLGNSSRGNHRSHYQAQSVYADPRRQGVISPRQMRRPTRAYYVH